jgi:hypothetical protein
MTNLLFFSYVIYELIVLIFLAKRVDRNIIYGSMCIYLLLGLQGAFIYTLLELLSPGSFIEEALSGVHDNSRLVILSRKINAERSYSTGNQMVMKVGKARTPAISWWRDWWAFISASDNRKKENRTCGAGTVLSEIRAFYVRSTFPSFFHA